MGQKKKKGRPHSLFAQLLGFTLACIILVLLAFILKFIPSPFVQTNTSQEITTETITLPEGTTLLEIIPSGFLFKGQEISLDKLKQQLEKFPKDEKIIIKKNQATQKTLANLQKLLDVFDLESEIQP